MYPDTDLPPKRITEERLARIRQQLPLNYWDRETLYRSMGVPEDLVRPLSISPFAPLYEHAVNGLRVPPGLAAAVLVRFVKQLRREGLPVERLSGEMLHSVFEAIAQRRIAREGIPDLLRRSVETGRSVAELLPTPCTDGELLDAVRQENRNLDEQTVRRLEKRQEILMGRVMRRVRGRVDGARVAQAVAGEVE
jgi:glutamyl-tRNA(Gln) amidotransferase subunit E